MNSKRKGNQGERELGNFLSSHGVEGARRGVQYAGSPESPDVVGMKGYHIECKRYKRISMMRWLEQSIRDSGKDEKPVVMFREDRGEWCICMKLEDFLEVYHE